MNCPSGLHAITTATSHDKSPESIGFYRPKVPVEKLDPKESKYVLSDDSPKENPWQDDRLGYKPFAERLSRVIFALSAPNGYVIGLNGEWGSGKSTAINFVKKFIEKFNEELEDSTIRTEIIDYRPWIVAGHEDLVTAFFQVVSEKLLGKTKTRTLNRFLKVMQKATDPTVDAVAKVAVVAANPVSGVAVKTAGFALKSAIGKFLDEPSLQTAYDELRKSLQERKQKFLVIIDDLDRLRRDEIRSIMQMVKTVGQLPNVIYLLAYDREIVWSALDDGIAQNRVGPNFGEKIVQQEIQLPRPSKHDLLAILDSEIEPLLGAAPINVRWHFLVRDGIRRWVRQPRDVHRLANAVKFSWPALAGEIDPFDLLIMEGLRLFDEKVFEWIKWNRDWIFSQGLYEMSDEDTRKTAIGRLRSKIPEDEVSQVWNLMTYLFPQKSQFFERHTADERHSDVVRRRGIGCEAGYDAYFSLYPSPDEVPKSVVDEAMTKLNDERFLNNLFRSYIEKKDRNNKSMAGRLFEELAFRFIDRDGPAPTQDLLNALFKVGVAVYEIADPEEFFGTTPYILFRDLIDRLLTSWGPEAAKRHLERAFKECGSVFVNSLVYVSRGRELKLIPGDSGPPLMTKDDFKALGEVLLPQIELAASDGRLAQAPFYWSIIAAWKHLAGSAPVKEWIEKNIRNTEGFLSKLLLGLLSYSIGNEGRSYSMERAPDPQIYDHSLLVDAITNELSRKTLSDDQRNRMLVVVDWLRAYLKQTAEAPEKEMEKEGQVQPKN